MSATPMLKRNCENDADDASRSVRSKNNTQDPPPGAKYFIPNQQQLNADTSSGVLPSELSSTQELQKKVAESLHHKELYKQAAETLNSELEETKAKLVRESFELRKANSKINSLNFKVERHEKHIADLIEQKEKAKADKEGLLIRITRVEEALDAAEEKFHTLNHSHRHLQIDYEELGDTNESLRKDLEFMEKRNAEMHKTIMNKDALIKELRQELMLKPNANDELDAKNSQIATMTSLLEKQTNALKEACEHLIDPISAELSTSLILLESGQPISLEGIVRIWMGMDKFAGDPYTPISCPTTRMLVGPVKDQVSSNFINRIAESLSIDPDVDTQGSVYLRYRPIGSTTWQTYPITDQLQIMSKLVIGYKKLMSQQSSSYMVQVKGKHLVTINGDPTSDILSLGLTIFDSATRTTTPCEIQLTGQEVLFDGCSMSA